MRARLGARYGIGLRSLAPDHSAGAPRRPSARPRSLNDPRIASVRLGTMRVPTRSILLPAFLLSLAPSRGAAQETPWPAPRSSHAMAWHAGLEQVVLLGGVEAVSRGQWMWAWDGVNWSVLDTIGPGDRGHFGFAYDAGRDRLVLHGGLTAYPDRTRDPLRHGDTWEWDGSVWRAIASEGPGVRDHTAMAYDPEREVVVLFGGGRPDQTLLADTWSWDGDSWRQVASDGPPARATHRLVWDDRRRVLVLFGGWGADGLLADTWTWDGTAWTEIGADAPGPAPRFASRMAFDAGRGEIVLFGGRGDAGDFDDTWIWDGAAWTRRDVEGPGLLNVHEMAYDPVRQRVVLFGGFHAGETYADVWEWDGTAWEQILPD